MSCKKVYSKKVLHFTERLICNMIYVCIARKTERSLYEYEQSDQSKRMGGVLKKLASFTPRVFLFARPCPTHPNEKG